MKKILAFAFVIVMLSSFSVQAQTIALDNSADMGSGLTPFTTANYTASGTNRIIFLSVLDTGGGSNRVTGVTFGGISMIKIGEDAGQGASVGTPSLWMLVNPTSVASTFVINGSAVFVVRAVAVSYTGASQSGQPDANITGNSAGTTDFTLTLTTIANNSWTTTANANCGGTLSGGAGTTIRINDAGILNADSNAAITPAGPTSLTIHRTVSCQWAGVIAAFSPFSNPVPTTASISPNSAMKGSSGFTMTVNGTNFISSSVVQFNGSGRSTTFVSSTQLTAQILTSDLVTAGPFPITVFNPSPGGGTSNSQTFTVTPNPIDNLDVPLSTRNAEATQLLIKTKTDNLTNLDILLSALRDAITAPSPNNKTLKDLFDQLQSILNQLDVALSTRASESTLVLAKGVLDSIKAKTDNLDVLLSTIASETTQLLVKSALDAIKAKTDNLDALLSSRASELTLQGVKAGTDKLDTNLSTRASEATLQALLEGTLWQRRSFEGKGFIVTTNEITVTSTAETDFVLINNPAASGKLHRANQFTVTVRTNGQNVRLRIYKNPTITTDGNPLTVNNVRTTGNIPVTLAFSLPTIFSRGQLIAAYSRNADSLDRPFDLSLYLEQGESYLITVQGTVTGNDYMFTYTFVEE